ncbi:MAG: dihydrofolate reductase [Bacteroidetes bacterium RIFOXYA12_FULL_35_11]|nr:MAG: dihydrofolate reductase [Bacteroidetes bacterium GWF2_35_48]OFY74693.1 MAG: dihydrofolate reductase [Bacteroidetes bacterium RIFOXYA12_FULL_35_11]
MMSTMMISCNSENKKDAEQNKSRESFKFLAEQFADIKIMRYQIPGFDSLTAKQKELVYYLSEAALCGRDITFDQNYKHNLLIRRTLETIYDGYKGDKTSEEWNKFVTYMKRVWFSNGIHHHYSNDKFIPEFTNEYFTELVKNTEGNFPIEKGQNINDLLAKIVPVMFDPKIDAKRVNQQEGIDLVKSSASNFYEGVTEKEVEDYYKNIIKKDNPQPISYGLNSKLVKENGKLVEKVYKEGGMYSDAISKIIYWLEKAATVAENDIMKNHLQKLIAYYKTGDLQTWDDYNILWVKDNDSHIDYVNGFIEVYGDPLGMKATWEAVVNFKDINATKRAQTISANAQWFEDNSPVDSKFKKKEVKGVTAKVITVAQLGGDCYPSTPIGINLPNADWIRKDHGSKSVTMDNITYAYDQAALGNGFMEEFCFSPEEIELQKKHGSLASNLHTDLHECLGHGSGQLLPGVSTDAMKNYHSPLEEARADLFALYYMMDQKMVDLGLMSSLECAKAEYNSYIRNGMMTQLTRVELGKNIEQAHMRNRQLIAKWCFEKGEKDKVIEKKTKDGKTFFVINDYQKLRNLFGKLLAEIQRIKSTGDFEAGKKIVETYAVKVDPELHKEVKTRYEKLKLAPYGGFINPVLKPVMESDKIIDVKVEYPDNYIEQMMHYSKKYSFLPTYN